MFHAVEQDLYGEISEAFKTLLALKKLCEDVMEHTYMHV